MKALRVAAFVTLIAAVAQVLVASTATSAPKTPRFLVFTASYGFQHDGVQEAVAEIRRQSAETRAFTVEVSNKASAFSRATYRRVDGVILVNTTGLGGGNSPLTAAQRKDFINYFGCGGALVGVHAAADSGGDWPAYDTLLGSYGFDAHPHYSLEARDNPLGRNAFNPAIITDVTIQVEDRKHAVTRPWHGFDSFRLTDEIYRYKRNPRTDKRTHVVLSLDEESHYWRRTIGAGPAAGGLAPEIPNPVANPMNSLEPTAMPDDNPIAWVRTYGSRKARVFYTNLGHNIATWERSDFRGHIFEGIRWVSGRRPDARCVKARFG